MYAIVNPRLGAAALIHNSNILMRRLIEGGAYSNKNQINSIKFQTNDFFSEKDISTSSSLYSSYSDSSSSSGSYISVISDSLAWTISISGHFKINNLSLNVSIKRRIATKMRRLSEGCA